MTFSSFKKTWISYPNYFLCHGFCENWLGGSGEKMKTVKGLETDRPVDEGQKVITKANLSCQAKVS